MSDYRVRSFSTPSPDWQQAEVMTNFSLPWDAGVAPSRTEFRALHDGSHLHFRFDCDDGDLVLGSGETVKERVLDSDRVELFFAPDLSLNTYYCLEMTPLGEVLAYKAVHYRQMDWEWRCPELCLAASRHPGGYQVIGSLPLSVLSQWGMPVSPEAGLCVGVFRADFSHTPDGLIQRRWMPWCPPGTDKADFHVPSAFGRWFLV